MKLNLKMMCQLLMELYLWTASCLAMTQSDN